MNVYKRYFDFEKDYDIIKSWWEAHGSFAPMKEHLSKSGYLIEIDNVPTCAGFLYTTDSKICVFEFVVSNPKVDKSKRQTALDLLIDKAKNWARAKEFSLIYTSISIPSYIKTLKESGFIEADTNQTHMFFQL